MRLWQVQYREPWRISLSIVIYLLIRESLTGTYVQRTIEEYPLLYGDFGSLWTTSAVPLADPASHAERLIAS
jgi:hypothetical protein